MASGHQRAQRVIVAGVVRNGASHLPAVLANFSAIGAAFAEARFIVVENDSIDSTKAILAQWAQANGPAASLFTLDGLGHEPARTVRLAAARNVIVEAIRADPLLSGFDRLCLLDMDDVAARPLDRAALNDALAFMDSDAEIGAVFANQLGTYFDMWALRHPQWCPDDPWFEVLEEVWRRGIADDTAFAATMEPRLRSIDPAAQPISVESAFGGFGLYRLEAVLANPNPYLGTQVRVMMSPDGSSTVVRMQACEHVHFHRGLRQLGKRLYVFPRLINLDCGTLQFDPGFWRSLLQ